MIGRRNQPKSLSGIETQLADLTGDTAKQGRNQPKSLSGIETILKLLFRLSSRAGINLNPYQGLKLFCVLRIFLT